MKEYKPKEICELTGLTRKLLCDYHNQGIVKAAKRKATPDGRYAYKSYDEEAFNKLWQVAIYKDLGLERNEIKKIMCDPNYDSNRALDDLLTRLRDKQKKIERYVAVVERLKLLGTKNDILSLFNGISLEKMGKNINMSLNSLHGSDITEGIEDDQIENLGQSLTDLISELNNLSGVDPSGTVVMDIIGKMFKSSIQSLGLLGYMLVLTIVLSTLGEGTAIKELNELCAEHMSVAHAKTALLYIEKDFDEFFDQLIQVIARYHEVMGAPYSDPLVAKLVDDVKEICALHYGLRNNEEYRLFFELLDIEICTGSGKYLNYVLNAVKYYTET